MLGLKTCIVSLEPFSNNPPVNIHMNYIIVNVSTLCAPQVLLPLKKWEAAWLGWLSAVPVPKATFLKGLCSTWGFNSVILPKNAGKKQVTSLPALEPRGNPSRADGDAGRAEKAGAFGIPCSS